MYTIYVEIPTGNERIFNVIHKEVDKVCKGWDFSGGGNVPGKPDDFIAYDWQFKSKRKFESALKKLRKNKADLCLGRILTSIELERQDKEASELYDMVGRQKKARIVTLERRE